MVSHAELISKGYHSLVPFFRDCMGPFQFSFDKYVMDLICNGIIVSTVTFFIHKS